MEFMLSYVVLVNTSLSKSVNAQLVLVLVLHKTVQTTSEMFCPNHTKTDMTRYIITKHVFWAVDYNFCKINLK